MTRLTLRWHLRGIAEGAEDGAHTTGFPKDGRFCDAYDVPASRALRADDTVSFLDALAHDPTRRYVVRVDAASLLDEHVWPESPCSQNSFANAEREDVDVAEWHDAGFVRKSIGPTYLLPRCVNPSCTEAECLADPDVLRDEGVAQCMVCMTEQPIPSY